MNMQFSLALILANLCLFDALVIWLIIMALAERYTIVKRKPAEKGVVGDTPVPDYDEVPY